MKNIKVPVELIKKNKFYLGGQFNKIYSYMYKELFLKKKK